MVEKVHTYEVFSHDAWGAHPEGKIKAPNKTAVYERFKKRGYTRSQLEVFLVE